MNEFFLTNKKSNDVIRLVRSHHQRLLDESKSVGYAKKHMEHHGQPVCPYDSIIIVQILFELN